MSTRSAGLAVVLLAVLAHGLSLHAGFTLDDRTLILANPQVRSLANIPAMFGVGHGLPEARAVRNASDAVDWMLGGGSPLPFHVSNLLFHALASWLVFAVGRRLLLHAALPAALLFAVHPVHTEAVDYVSGRKDVLATIFVLSGLLAFLKWRSGGGIKWLAAFGAAFAAGVLSKEVAAVLPALCLAVDVALGGWRAAGRRWPFHATFAALVVAVGALVLVVWNVSAVASASGLHYPAGSLAAMLPTILRIWARYLGLLVFPVRLLADYSFDALPLSSGFFEGRVLASIALLSGFVVALVVAWRRERLLGFVLLWIALALAPVSQLVPHHELLSEHNLYLPSVGFCLAAGWLLAGVRARPLLAIIAILFCVLTVDRSADWRDSRTLLESAVRVAPRSARAHFNLARLSMDDRDPAAARRHLEAVVEIGPGPDAPSNRAYVAAQNELAVQAMREPSVGSVEAEARLRAAIAASPLEAGSTLNLASVLALQGRFADAAAALEGGLQAGATDEAVSRSLARARLDGGAPSAAVLAPLSASMRTATDPAARAAGLDLLLRVCDQRLEEEPAILTLRALGRRDEARSCSVRLLDRLRAAPDLKPSATDDTVRKRALRDARTESERCAEVEPPSPLDTAAMERALAHLRSHVRVALSAERARRKDPSLADAAWRAAEADRRRLFGDFFEPR